MTYTHYIKKCSFKKCVRFLKLAVVQKSQRTKRDIADNLSFIGYLCCTANRKHHCSASCLFLPGTLPSPKETIKGNIKTVTEYKIDDDGKKTKVFSDFGSKLHICNQILFLVCHNCHALGLHMFRNYVVNQ